MQNNAKKQKMNKKPQIFCVGSIVWDIIGRSNIKMPLGADRPGKIIKIPGGVATPPGILIILPGLSAPRGILILERPIISQTIDPTQKICGFLFIFCFLALFCINTTLQRFKCLDKGTS